MASVSKLKLGLACLFACSSTLKAEDDLIHGHIGANTNQLNRNIGDVPGNRFNANMSFDYWKNPDINIHDFETRFTLAAQANDQGLLMYSAQEAYVGGWFTKYDHFRIGRQILDWSAVDATWGFGKLNNRRNFDYFEPGQEGLVGFEYDLHAVTGFRFKAFGSPLFIPELNPGLDINNSRGTITSRHPWTDVPATTADVNGITKNIEYNVHYPKLADIIYRFSGGLNLGYENKHWLAEGFYMRKPENTLSSQVEVKLDPIKDVIKADVTPQVYYHDLYGGTLKYSNREIQMYVSGMAVRPNSFPDNREEATRYTEIKTEKRREDYMGGGISFVKRLYSYGFNYVARLSPFDRQREQLALDPRWNQALNFFGVVNLGERVTLSTDLKYDMLTTDRLFMARAFFKLTKAFVANVGMNLIGTPTNGKSYWSPYTNNDQLYMGLRYIF